MPEQGLNEWGTIGELAARVGGYCWVENYLFEVTGAWAGVADHESPWDADFRVFFAAASLQHADLAARWRDRLPVRAGIDRDALVVPPAGALASHLHALDAGTGFEKLLALVRGYLPHLVRGYSQHLAVANPASDAPVMAVLGEARRTGSDEMGRGQFLFDEGVRRGWFGRRG
jgi:hypothetical protein